MRFTQRCMLKDLIIIAAVGFFLCGITTPGAWAQDLTLHETTSSTGMAGRGGGNTTQTRYITSNAIKITSSSGSDTIIQLAEGKIITIDNGKKTYSEVTVKQLNDMLAKLTSTQENAENAEAMAAMRKMMGQVSDSITVTKAGPGENIAGYATEKYVISGMLNMEIWAAPDLKMPALYYDAMKMQAVKNPMFDMSKLYDEMKKIQGTAVKTVMTMKMMDMEMKTTSVVTSVEKTPIPASVFQVPAGYKLVATKVD
ncbi:MAG: hypothetical protein H6Q04_205 [Acidobacteria bacterium]|nr:hypothetical protein [Acidobacteriota bacterium]